jgi:hypothetical protein
MYDLIASFDFSAVLCFELYVELKGLDSDSIMEDSWSLMEFSLFQG